MAVQGRAFFRTAEDVRVHRQTLYRCAAPVFEQRGYRGAGLKELASASGLSIPGLYRYFPSKRDFALYPLSAANRPTDACFESAPDDPYVHLQLWIDHAAWERRDFVLALRLATERGGLGDEHLQTFGYHIGLVARLMCATAPRLSERGAREAVESMLAMSFGASTIGARWSPTIVRARFLQLLVRDLVRGGAKTTELSRILAADAHPPHGPCSIEVASAADSFANGSGRLTAGATAPNTGSGRIETRGTSYGRSSS